jgi:hypothetical protein
LFWNSETTVSDGQAGDIGARTVAKLRAAALCTGRCAMALRARTPAQKRA